MIVHQALKDLRLLRWPLAAWVLAIVATRVLFLYASSLSPSEPSLDAWSNVGTALGIAGAGVFVLIAALLVQQDSPVNANAFWLTRPTPAGRMLASKLLVAVLVLVLLPVAGDAVDYVAAGLGLQWLPPLRVPLQMVWALPVMAIAAVAVDLPQFVLFALAEIVLLVAATALARAFGLSDQVTRQMGVLPVCAIVLATFVLTWQYLTRRTAVAAVLLVVAPFVITLGIDVWPWAPAPVALYPDAQRRRISFVADRGAVTSFERIGNRVIQIPIAISGRPANTGLSLVYDSVHGTLQRDGSQTPLDTSATFTTGLRPTDAIDPPTLSPDDPRVGILARRFASALGGTTLMNPQMTPIGGRLTVSIMVRGADLPRLAGATGTLHLEFDVDVREYRAPAGVPAAAGAGYDAPGLHGTILETVANVRGVTLRTREAASGWHAWNGPEWVNNYLLRNTVAGQSLLDTQPTQGRTDASFGSAGASLAWPLSRDIVLGWKTLRFAQGIRTPTFASDAEARRWLKDAELVTVLGRLAGQFHVTLELPEFTIGG